MSISLGKICIVILNEVKDLLFLSLSTCAPGARRVANIPRIAKPHDMQMSPVQRGLPANPKDRPRSNFSFHSKSTQALIRIAPLR
jgi:hypothetical protein